MSTPARITVVSALALTGFTAVYLAHPPTPKYFPLERAWHLVEPGNGPGMGWYGRSGVALIAGGIFAGIGYAVAASLRIGREGKLPGTFVNALTIFIFGVLLLLVTAVVYEQFPWLNKPAHRSTFAESGSAYDE